VLHSIYELRRNENRPDEKEITKIEHALSMIHFLSKDFEKMDRFAKILMDKTELDKDITDQLKTMTDFLARDK